MSTRDSRQFLSSVTRPLDFDRFWGETLAEADRVPLNASFERDDLRSADDVDVFDVRYDSVGGLRIAGWYVRPAGASGPLPGILVVPGYVSEPKIPKDLARQGYAVFSAAPRGKLRSNDGFNPGYPGLLTHNITDRDTYAYRWFYVDAVRAFDALAARPEVDPSRLAVTGSSQGGALTLLVSALRPGKVRAAAAGAPYLCSMMDAAALTHSYPYQEINEYLRLNPDDEPVVRDVLAYFDIQNFASHVQCPIIVNIGFQDDVCPPETGFAVFREIGSAEKRLYPYEKCGHDAGSGAGHGAIVDEFLATHLRPEPGPHAGSSAASTRSPQALAARRAPTPAEGPDFDAYWGAVDREAKALRRRKPVIEEMPLRSTEGSTTYAVTLPGIADTPGGPRHRVFAYYSVPGGDGPFPALLQAPGYGSVVHIPPFERRQRYAVLGLCHRGQRLSDAEYAAAYPGLLTDGLDDPAAYRYRGVVADVLVALDFLAGRPEVNADRIGVAGSELGLIGAALRPGVARAVLVSTPLLFRGALDRLQGVTEYPLEEFNDYLRAFPGRRPGVAATLALFDPLAFASRLGGEVLLACTPGDAGVAGPLRTALGEGTELYVNTGRGATDHAYAEEWLERQLGG